LPRVAPYCARGGIRREATSLQEAIERLPERHRYVLVRRYGLDDREPATLAELYEELKVSRERIRQLQRAAEQSLKSRMLTGGREVISDVCWPVLSVKEEVK